MKNRPIRLANISTRAPENVSKDETKEKLPGILDELDELQNLLFANHTHSVLAIVQGMDASGKDGAIKNVFGALNPQGVSVTSFKAPTEDELSHDFLWRIHRHTPAKGCIKVFNRSHYEDVLITRVHQWISEETVKERMHAINDFERMLQQNGTIILKFYLHVSQEKQQERFSERIKIPRKQWKYSAEDFKEAKLRDKYITAYEDCFARCSDVPWNIVPADQNWYKEFTIANILLQTLKDLKMAYPKMQQEVGDANN